MDWNFLPGIHSIWTDFDSKLHDGWDIQTLRDEYFEKLRKILRIEVIWWNFWHRGHRKSSTLIYKQIPTWKENVNCGTEYVTREEFESAREFIEARNIDMDGERLPTREDIMALEWNNSRVFLDWENYIFDDWDQWIWVFRIGADGTIEFPDMWGEMYGRIKTIKNVEPYSKIQLERLSALKKCDWISRGKKERIKVTSEYIDINGVRLKLEDEPGERDGTMFRWYIQPYTLENDQWQRIIDFIWNNPMQQYQFFHTVLWMKKPHYVTASEPKDDRYANEFLLNIDPFDGVTITEEFSEWPENWCAARFRYAV